MNLMDIIGALLGFALIIIGLETMIEGLGTTFLGVLVVYIAFERSES